MPWRQEKGNYGWRTRLLLRSFHTSEQLALRTEVRRGFDVGSARRISSFQSLETRVRKVVVAERGGGEWLRTDSTLVCAFWVTSGLP